MTNIYFARVGEYVKIGMAVNVQRRMACLLSNSRLICPDDLDYTASIVVVKTIPGCRQRDELNMHLLFAQHWVAGEWFRWSPNFRFQMETMQFVTHAERLVLLRKARRELGVVPSGAVKEARWGKLVHQRLADAQAERLAKATASDAASAA